MPTEPLLRCCDMAVGYDVPLLSGLNFTVEPGTVTLVSGPNGAGKTTLARTLFGLVPPLEGTVEWSLPGVGTPTPHALVATGARFLGQGPRGFPAFTVARQISVLARLHALSGPAAAPAARTRVGALSYGQRRLAALRTLMVGRPICYILDEPFAGLDRPTALALLDELRGERERGAAILIIEHRADLLVHFAEMLIVIEGRRVIYFGAADGRDPPRSSLPPMDGGTPECRA